MNLQTIKATLAKHGLHIWQLANQLGVSRDMYYEYAHHGFKGKKTKIRKAIRDLIKKGDAE